MPRVYVSGYSADEAALSTALHDAMATHPDATLVFNKAHPVGVLAAELWNTEGLPFEPLDDAGPPAFIQDQEIIASGVDLVIACVHGTRPEGRSAAIVARQAGVPVVVVGDWGLG